MWKCTITSIISIIVLGAYKAKKSEYCIRSNMHGNVFGTLYVYSRLESKLPVVWSLGEGSSRV